MLAAALSLALLTSTPSETATPAVRPDSVALEPAGSYPFRAGVTLVVDSARSLAFAGSGAGVFTIDVSDPRNPEVLSDRIRGQDMNRGLWLDGDRLFSNVLPDGPGYNPDRIVEIWDVGDPRNPVMLGSVDHHSYGPGVWARDTVLLAAGFHYLFAYNIADPSSPVPLDTVLLRTGVGIDQFQARDTLVFCAENAGGIDVYNIADPANLELVAQWPEWLASQFPGVQLAGDRLYMTCGFGPLGRYSGLWVFDITDPLNGQLLGAFDTIETYAHRCAVHDTFALVGYRNGGPLKVVSVADPANMYLVDSLRPGISSMDVAWFGSLAYVTYSDRFIVYDMTDPAHPAELGAVPISLAGSGIARTGDLLLSAGSQLSVLHRTGYDDLEMLGVLDFDGSALKVEAQDSLALVTGWRRDESYRLWAVDCHDPANPVVLGTDSLLGPVAGIAVIDSVGCVATETGLYLRDLLRPGLPVVGSLAVAMVPGRLVVRDTLCFVSGDRLRVFDIADPVSIRLVADTAVEAVDLALRDTLLVTVSQYSAKLFSVSDPAHPCSLSRFTVYNARSVALADTLLVVGGATNVYVWSVADPTEPRRLGGGYVEEYVNDIDLQGDLVFTSEVRCYRLNIIPQGISEGHLPGLLAGIELCPALVRGVLALRGGHPASLLDISGRKVVDLVPGENDIRHIAPGVYFVRRPETEDGRPRTAVRKVVVQK
jgi:hypothetical protein